MKYLLIMSAFSILFPVSFSRIMTTFDSPGEYSLSFTNSSNQQNNEFTYNTKEGLSIAYEHMITEGKVTDGIDIYLFAGGEFMIGRRSDVNVSFHSIYIKPIIGITDRFMITFRGGLTSLNTEQRDFILDMGSVLSLGFEYNITDNLSLLVSKSYYNLFEDSYPESQEFPIPPMLGLDMDENIDLQSTDVDMKYVKTGISIIYGFETQNKRTK